MAARKNRKLNYIETGGGPFILLPLEFKSSGTAPATKMKAPPTTTNAPRNSRVPWVCSPLVQAKPSSSGRQR